MRFGIVAVAATMLLAAPALASVARVKSVTGLVKIEREGKVFSAQPGVVLEAGDTIVTSPRSKIGATFIDNTRIAIAPASRIAITAFEYDETTYRGRLEARLDKGMVAIVAGRLARSGPAAVKIKTAKAAYVIRGGRVVVKAQ